MARFIKDRSKAKGLAPGSLVLIGKRKMDQPEIHKFEYDSSHLKEKQVRNIKDISPILPQEGVNWINIYGIHDMEMIQQIGNTFGLPSLLLEDILNTDQRPKYDAFEKFDAFILKMLHFDEEQNQIKAEQITLILGNHFVLTLQERRGDVFTPVRERIRNSKGRIRNSGNDYLVYALLDTIADNYAIVVEFLGQKIESLEDRIFHSNETGLAEEIYKLKTELNFLRKTIRPVKELIFNLLKNENNLFEEKSLAYLKDLNDLINQSTEAIELYNNLVSDQLNIYNTNMSNRMNEVMKVLTIFASIFIPLTFLAGIYGMNFEYIPELKFKYSYPIFWLLVIVTGGGLLYYFKRKRWL